MTDLLASVRRRSRSWWAAAMLATFFLALHLPFLASTLEDVDSVNFALGLRDFDPGRHRPHPPGYPIYMALGKAADLVLSEPRALAIWGALAGALAAFALLRLFACLDALDGGEPSGGGRVAVAGGWISPPVVAMLLTMTAPLYWMTASRPMSDTAGLAVALAAQAILLTAMVRKREAAAAGAGVYDAAVAAQSGRLVLLGAFVAAIAIGFRSQAAWLTLPLLVLVIFDRTGRGAAGALIGSVVWMTVGTLLWLVPLVVASGGPSAYYRALTVQAGEDWSGVDLLATNFGLRRLAFALNETFIRHWSSIGWMVLAFAGVGGLLLLWRGRRALLVLIAAYVPYLIFHLLFQETVTTRYALPLVVPTAYLATRALFADRWFRSWIYGPVMAGLCLMLVVPDAVQYSLKGSPVARALADIRGDAAATPGVAVGMHHPFARPVEADSIAPATALLARPKHEWLSLVERWRGGAMGPVWFLADPDRTDLALVDPQSRMVRGQYAWPFPSQVMLGGVRPDGLQWIVIKAPGWFAGEGWHLTPETAGVARADGAGLGRGPITAWVRRREGPLTLMIGGRHLGSGSGPTVRVSVRLDGRDVETWDVAPSMTSFLRFFNLPAGALAGSGPWATLEIAAVTTAGGTPTEAVAIDQFDAQDPGTPTMGFGEGWQEPEHNPATGLSWRWTSRRSTIHVSAVDRDVELQIVGESPLRYFAGPSRVVVSAGGHQLLSAGAGDDFAWSVRVSAAILRESGGAITLETNQAFKPADRGENADRRDLGLRIFAVTIKPVF